jgi:GNAT superfamily N-acetyltransferase
MTIHIRQAVSGDLPSLGKLGAMLMQTHYDFDPQRFLEPRPGAQQGYASFLGGVLEADDAAVFVAQEDDEIVGYAFVALEPLSWKELRGPAGFVHDLVVVESARRSGIGQRLMSAAIEWLRDRGAPRVILGTAAKNAAAQSLFHHLGFRDTMIEMTLELPKKG